MKKSEINPARYIPSELTQTIIHPEYGIEVHYCPTALSAIGYAGKGKKHEFYYRFKNQERLMSHINSFVETQIESAERKIAAKLERKKQNSEIMAADHFSIGDIIVNSWGWEQTNIEFYKVTAIKNKTIEIAAVYSAMIKDSMYSHGMACEVVPTDELKPDGQTYKLRVKSGYNGSVALSQPASYYYMHKWNGKPQYKSWYA